MRREWERLVAQLQAVAGVPVVRAFPEATDGVSLPVLCVQLEGVSLRAAGLGEGRVKIGRARLKLSVLAESAEAAIQSASPLELNLDGLQLSQQGPVFRPELHAFAVTYVWVTPVVLTGEDDEEQSILSFDWKGEFTV